MNIKFDENYYLIKQSVQAIANKLISQKKIFIIFGNAESLVKNLF